MKILLILLSFLTASFALENLAQAQRGVGFGGRPVGPGFGGRPIGPGFGGRPIGPGFSGVARGPGFNGNPNGIGFQGVRRGPGFEPGPAPIGFEDPRNQFPARDHDAPPVTFEPFGSGF